MSVIEELLASIAQILEDSSTDADCLKLRQLLSGAETSGERSLAISGDANGATIATGDGNTILNITFQADGL